MALIMPSFRLTSIRLNRDWSSPLWYRMHAKAGAWPGQQRPRSSRQILLEISFWFLTVHGRPKGQTERYRHAEHLKMIITFY